MSRVVDMNSVLDRMASAYRLMLLAVQESGNPAEVRHLLEMTGQDRRLRRMLAARPETLLALVGFLHSVIGDSRIPVDLRATCQTILDRHRIIVSQDEEDPV
jgi:hypothetical protein